MYILWTGDGRVIVVWFHTSRMSGLSSLPFNPSIVSDVLLIVSRVVLKQLKQIKMTLLVF